MLSINFHFYFIRPLLFCEPLCIVSINKMKIFQIIQTNFKVLGITPSQSSRHHSFNANILLTIAWCVFSTASYTLWFIYTANSSNDYLDAGLFTFESLICTVGLLVLFWKRNQWCQFIENLEIMLNKRELNFKLHAFCMRIYLICILHCRVNKSTIENELR